MTIATLYSRGFGYSFIGYADSPNEMYKFYQTEHEKKIINGTIPGTYANKVCPDNHQTFKPSYCQRLKMDGGQICFSA